MIYFGTDLPIDKHERYYVYKQYRNEQIHRKKKWHYRTGDILKEFQIIWNFPWEDMKNVTFEYR